MKKGARLLLIAIGLLPFSCAANAQQGAPETQVGNFLFTVPTGWNPQQKGDIMYILAPAPPPGTTGFIALSANDLEGDLQNSFNVLWSGFAKSYRILRGGEATPTHVAGHEAFYAEAIASDQQGRRWHVLVVGTQYKKRIQTVTFMNNFPQSYDNASFNIFRQWLANLKFGDALPGSNIPHVDAAEGHGTTSASSPDAEDKPHAVTPGMLEGFYVGGSVTGSGRISIGSLYFSPDGWVVKINLNDSMIGFDLTAYRNSKNTNRSWVGRYRVDGNDIHILWQDYTEHRDLIHRNEASAHPGLNSFVPTCRCTGKHFAGKYNYGLATSGQYLQFFADGTFIDHGVTDQMIVPSAFYEHPRTQRGTYAIQSQTMIFGFADGHRGMRTFIAPKAQEKGPTFDWIGLGIDTLYEEHYQSEP